MSQVGHHSAYFLKVYRPIFTINHYGLTLVFDSFHCTTLLRQKGVLQYQESDLFRLIYRHSCCINFSSLIILMAEYEHNHSRQNKFPIDNLSV